MRQRLAIFITIALLLGVLIALYSASNVRIERAKDTESRPDRSTYNSGATGTRALYDFLNESGRKVVRWRDAPAALMRSNAVQPKTFVVVGETIIDFEQDEVETLLRWVESGGRLVIIDRRPDIHLLPASGNWRITTELQHYPSSDTQAANPEEMTAGVALVRAAQPTLLTRNVDTVSPSRFAALIRIIQTNSQTPQPSPHPSAGNRRPGETYRDNNNSYGDEEEAPPAPAPSSSKGAKPSSPSPTAQVNNPHSPAPVVHLANSQGALLVDYAYGAGRIVVLSDPFIVANSGISRADNLQLAVNTVAGTSDGVIAFDEYHQGRRATQNEMLAYFAGTPVLAMLAQFSLIVMVVLWSRGRRFARPLPLPQVDRRSKLEFVASMAELQQRARAYDLAIENIYTRTRRVLARYAGVDYNSPRSEIATRVAARSKLDRQQLEALMQSCEDAIAGEPISARQSLELVARLREVERALGLRMRAREIRQVKER
jgi:hypothetical protein